MRKTQISQFSVLLLIGGLVACTHSPIPLPDSHSSESLPVNQTPSHSSGQDSSPQEQSDSSRDPLQAVKQAWEEGRKEGAQRAFLRPEVEILRHGKRAEEWRFWRGRLFLTLRDGAWSGLLGDNVSALYQDGDDLWVGTWTGGLCRISLPFQHSTVFDPGAPSLAVRTVQRIRPIKEGLVVVRYGGLDYYRKRGDFWLQEQDLPVTERLQDVLDLNGVLYLASLGDGLWEKGSQGWTRLVEAGAFVTRLEKGLDGSLLIGTMEDGVLKYDPHHQEWEFPPSSPLQNANITSIQQWKDGYVVGTRGDGVFYWNVLSQTILSLNPEGIGDPWVLDIMSDGEALYMATFGGGIRRWHEGEGKWSSLSLEDGLPTNDFTALASSWDGGLWAGSLGRGVLGLEKNIPW
ncbi:MAG: hypothetical protein MI717_15125 [Spirochaetales bacterium]|nr:hypothetical protein [Spirochaetales bacterium]